MGKCCRHSEQRSIMGRMFIHVTLLAIWPAYSETTLGEFIANTESSSSKLSLAMLVEHSHGHKLLVCGIATAEKRAFEEVKRQLGKLALNAGECATMWNRLKKFVMLSSAISFRDWVTESISSFVPQRLYLALLFAFSFK